MSEATVELQFVPYDHQREAHERRKRFSVLVWHRRGGKTVFAVLELVLAGLACEKPRGRFGYIAPLLKQAKTVAWDYLKQYTRQIPGCSVNESELSVMLPNGAQIRLYGADNPDALRGIYLDGVVLDEVADMKPHMWGEIVRPALSDRQGWALFIGTPKGVNLFSERYFAALKDPEWYADMRRWHDTSVLPAAEIEKARRDMTAGQFAQEYECDFGASVSNAIVPFAQALEASRRNVDDADYIHAAKILGVDVARYGDDRSVIAKRQGLVAFKMQTFRGLDNVELAGQVALVIDEWKPDAVFVDNSPASYGVIDNLRHLGHRVIAVDFGGKPGAERFENKRAEMWWLMSEWTKSGCTPDDNDLLLELTSPTYTYANARGKLQLESKDDMRKRGLPSPDKADALALTFAQPVAPKAVREERSPRMARTEFNPYEHLRGGR